MITLKKILIVLFALAFTQEGRSQCISVNLIKNPSLEDHSCCPNNAGMMDCAIDWTQPFDDGGTSEYLNTCGIDSLILPSLLPFFQHSYFGNGYAGICTDAYSSPLPVYREYIQGKLSEPLVAQQCYYCKFWVELFNFKNTTSFSANDAIGIFFSDTLPQKKNTDSMAMFYPAQINNPTGKIISDTTNWTQITGTFVANGGEQYFTVGTFKQEGEINKIYFGSPQTDQSYYFFDNFSLCPCEDTIPPPEPGNLVYVPNVFSPNSDGKNDKLYVRGENINQMDFKIYNRWGNLVYETTNLTAGWDGVYNSKDCDEGVYFYIAEITFVDGTTTLRKGNITLVR
jgi:gliding motility-associated-like protein